MLTPFCKARLLTYRTNNPLHQPETSDTLQRFQAFRKHHVRQCKIRPKSGKSFFKGMSRYGSTGLYLKCTVYQAVGPSSLLYGAESNVMVLNLKYISDQLCWSFTRQDKCCKFQDFKSFIFLCYVSESEKIMIMTFSKCTSAIFIAYNVGEL